MVGTHAHYEGLGTRLMAMACCESQKGSQSTCSTPIVVIGLSYRFGAAASCSSTNQTTVQLSPDQATSGARLVPTSL